MDKTQAFTLIIPAAGHATRMGLDTPKPYLTLAGQAILRHTINKFISIKGLQRVVVAINPEHIDLYHDAVQGLDNVSYIIGSDTRKNSIYNVLKSFSNVNNEEIILIHDAARPLVHEEDILTLLDTMQKAPAATLATPVSDTLYRQGDSPSREGLWAIQTPQAFRFSTLWEAHQKLVEATHFTDDASMVRELGHTVTLVPASRENFKITTPEDFKMAEKLMTAATETRATSGFDVHAFEDSPTGRPLMMGGIKIPHTRALAGHSDADVVLHAITDALLGALNAGDIGTHFPPSDAKWKDADSATFLKAAVDMAHKRGAQIRFVDVTILAEAPKIGPHRAAMQERIATIMALPPARISIKATTTEKLGFTGREEGIAAQALVTLTLPA